MENNKDIEIDIKNVKEILKKELTIPPYQRPYKWTLKNINELLNDIDSAKEKYIKFDKNFKYRLGTVILHKINNDKYEIVDGQQRIISLALLYYAITKNEDLPILKCELEIETSKSNAKNNYNFIENRLSLKKDKYRKELISDLENIFEFVVIVVKDINDAFQLFDSQNSRGKSLYPHDLLKAYHLREMNESKFDNSKKSDITRQHYIKKAVEEWEEKDSAEIHDLFTTFLFKILMWSRNENAKNFTANEIENYKGTTINSEYTFAKRASLVSQYPYFQIKEPFTSGKPFFDFVEYYINLKKYLVDILNNDDNFKNIKDTINDFEPKGMGLKYTINLFYAAVLFYYDKFNNLDLMAISKIFDWAFELRIIRDRVSLDSINKHALGKSEIFGENINIFYIIENARVHTEISNLTLTKKIKRESENK